MPRRYRHLTFEERCQVEILKKRGLSRCSIAQHPALISDQTVPHWDEAGCRTSDWNRRWVFINNHSRMVFRVGKLTNSIHVNQKI